MNKISCGVGTYGKIRVEFYGNENERISIGSYCSIADGVIFIAGGNHKLNCISTFPFKTYYYKIGDVAETKGKIIVDDDVWIGIGAIILSGVTIGRGAVVGAYSVVTKDVEPYAIVAGNPARFIRFRFSNKVIAKLKKINLNKLTKNSLKFLDENVNDQNIDEIIKDVN
jgi:Acetyltransferase (isoleucine patch superfamily)